MPPPVSKITIVKNVIRIKANQSTEYWLFVLFIIKRFSVIKTFKYQHFYDI